MNKKLNIIPKLLSSKVSIFIYLFLFFYLFVIPIISFIVPSLQEFKPTDATQLVLGNYTNVLSALGASIAAGTGVAVHTKVTQIKKNHDHLKKSHDEMKDSLNVLHSKIDAMSKKETKQ